MLYGSRIVPEKSNLLFRLDMGDERSADERSANVVLRNIKCPADSEAVMQIAEAAESILEYPIKRVEMVLPFEFFAEE